VVVAQFETAPGSCKTIEQSLAKTQRRAKVRTGKSAFRQILGLSASPNLTIFYNFFLDTGFRRASPLGYGMVIALIVNRGCLAACSGARRQGGSMSLTAKQQVTGENLAANRRSGPRLRGPVRLGPPALAGRTRHMNGLRKGRCENSAGEGGNKKDFASEATKCMKTRGELTKCHDENAKIRRKCG